MASELTNPAAIPPSVPPTLRRAVGDPLAPETWTPGRLSDQDRNLAKEAASRLSIWLQPTSDQWIMDQLAVLAHVFWAGEDQTAWMVKFKVYPAVLREYPQDLLAKAFRDGLAVWKFFPKPAEIVDQVKDETRRRRGEARRLRQLAQDTRQTPDAVRNTPEQQASVERGLANLHHWRGMITSKYTGPWPTPAEFQDNERYQAFIRNMHEMGVAA